jgi:hypothetical protein
VAFAHYPGSEALEQRHELLAIDSIRIVVLHGLAIALAPVADKVII